MRKFILVVLVCLLICSTTALSQSRRRSSSKSRATAAKAAAAEKTAADLKAGRDRVAAELKNLTRFIYLLAGITKTIEAADQSARGRQASPVALEQNERSKTKIKDSLKTVSDGLTKLEADFRDNPSLRNSYFYVSGVARFGDTAQNQAAANRFDEAGRTLLDAVGKLADALAAMH